MLNRTKAANNFQRGLALSLGLFMCLLDIPMAGIAHAEMGTTYFQGGNPLKPTVQAPTNPKSGNEDGGDLPANNLFGLGGPTLSRPENPAAADDEDKDGDEGEESGDEESSEVESTDDDEAKFSISEPKTVGEVVTVEITVPKDIKKGYILLELKDPRTGRRHHQIRQDFPIKGLKQDGENHIITILLPMKDHRYNGANDVANASDVNGTSDGPMGGQMVKWDYRAKVVEQMKGNRTQIVKVFHGKDGDGLSYMKPQPDSFDVEVENLSPTSTKKTVIVSGQWSALNQEDHPLVRAAAHAQRKPSIRPVISFLIKNKRGKNLVRYETALEWIDGRNSNSNTFINKEGKYNYNMGHDKNMPKGTRNLILRALKAGKLLVGIRFAPARKKPLATNGAIGIHNYSTATLKSVSNDTNESSSDSGGGAGIGGGQPWHPCFNPGSRACRIFQGRA